MVLSILVLLNVISLYGVNSIYFTENNVCATVNDYYTIHNNTNCWYDFITDLEMPELLQKAGREYEMYKVVTSDGHILTIFRMSNIGLSNRKKTPVFLQHGLISSSKHWVALGNDSLAFQLQNHGFDVWLGNYRGTKYSSEHTTYSVNNDAYWEHTIDDLALIDLPAMLDKVQEVTGVKKIIYVGHSLGGTIGLFYTSDVPLMAKKYIKASILVAPAYKLTHTVSPIRVLQHFADLIWYTVKQFKLMKVVSYGPITSGLIQLVCFQNAKILDICRELFGYIYGPKNGIRAEQIPNIVKLQATGSSIKVSYHLVSLLEGMFSKFDYKADNLKMYGQSTPPLYNVTNIEVPTMIIYAKNDWLTVKENMLELFEDMNKKFMHDIMEVSEENFNHLDFIFGGTARQNFVDPLLKHIESMDKL